MGSLSQDEKTVTHSTNPEAGFKLPRDKDIETDPEGSEEHQATLLPQIQLLGLLALTQVLSALLVPRA